MKVTKKEFFDYLRANPNKTAYVKQYNQCPFAKFLKENKKCQNVSVLTNFVEAKSQTGKYIYIENPPWLVHFIAKIDTAYSTSKRIKYSRVLSLAQK